jgi:hypothetical protein
MKSLPSTVKDLKNNVVFQGDVLDCLRYARKRISMDCLIYRDSDNAILARIEVIK